MYHRESVTERTQELKRSVINAIPEAMMWILTRGTGEAVPGDLLGYQGKAAGNKKDSVCANQQRRHRHQNPTDPASDRSSSASRWLEVDGAPVSGSVGLRRRARAPFALSASTQKSPVSWASTTAWTRSRRLSFIRMCVMWVFTVVSLM